MREDGELQEDSRGMGFLYGEGDFRITTEEFIRGVEIAIGRVRGGSRGDFYGAV